MHLSAVIDGKSSQLENESLEGSLLSCSLNCSSAHPSPGFMNLYVAQLLSFLQNSTEIEQYLLLPAAQTGGMREPLNLCAAICNI